MSFSINHKSTLKDQPKSHQNVTAKFACPVSSKTDVRECHFSFLMFFG